MRNRRLPGAGPRGRPGLSPGWRPRPSGSATAGPMTKASTPTTTSPSATSGWPSSTCRRPATSRCGPPTAATGWSSTARSTTTSSWARNCWQQGVVAAVELRLRGPARGLRPARQGRGAPAPRHVRLRDLGQLDAGAVLRPGPVRHQAVLLHAWTRTRSRSPAWQEQRAARGRRLPTSGTGDVEGPSRPGGADDWFAPRPGQGGGGPARGRPGTRPRPDRPDCRGQPASRWPACAGRPERMLRFASERKALADPGELRRPRPRRAAPVPGLPVRAPAGHADPADPGAAARPRA